MTNVRPPRGERRAVGGARSTSSRLPEVLALDLLAFAPDRVAIGAVPRAVPAGPTGLRAAPPVLLPDRVVLRNAQGQAQLPSERAVFFPGLTHEVLLHKEGYGATVLCNRPEGAGVADKHHRSKTIHNSPQVFSLPPRPPRSTSTGCSCSSNRIRRYDDDVKLEISPEKILRATGNFVAAIANGDEVAGSLREDFVRIQRYWAIVDTGVP